MKIQVTATLLAILTSLPMYGKYLELKNPAIHSLDGIAYMIDGEAIHDMLTVIQTASEVHYGKRSHSRRIGKYEFNGKKYSVSEFEALEKEHGIGFIPSEILAHAKKDFIVSTRHMVGDIKQAKFLILQLMEEFCQKRDKQDSLIMSWTDAEEDHEEETFDQLITSFKLLDNFLADLTLFLKDLIHNCPKAREQYKKWYLKKKR